MAGRPPYKPTEKDRRTVESMTGYGATQEEISRILGVSLPTLRKYYESEMQCGIVKANMGMAETLYQAGKNGNVTAMIFWLKARAGWREAQAPQTIDIQQSYVVRAPAPVDDAADWFRRYAPREALEHEPGD